MSSQNFNLRKMFEECVFANSPNKLTSFEIANWIIQNYPNECREKINRSSQDFSNINKFATQIASEVGAHYKRLQNKNPNICISEERPRRFYYNTSVALNLIDSAKIIKEKRIEERSSEIDLYPKLGSFLKNEYGIYCKRIDEKTSSNKQGRGANKWLHPDLVGLEDLTIDWQPATKECAKLNFDKRCNLYSFEVKQSIYIGNVRECFFQTVSNSSWANYGYLVAAELESSAARELQILCAAHGVGFIRLDANNIELSERLIPARYKEAIDWDLVNRLIEENIDFASYINEVKRFHLTGSTKDSDWDYYNQY
jgi:hypothetical protein